MKALPKITTTIFSVFFLLGCGSQMQPTPSQNSALESISPTNSTKKSGAMQNILDDWVDKEWTPTVSKDKKIQEKYMEKKVIKSNMPDEKKVEYVEKHDKWFTLQEYVDKMDAYSKTHPNDEENSHVHKMESMPVIGK